MTLPPPLIVNAPLPGDHFGPGFAVRGGLGVGPLPVTDVWQLVFRGGPAGSEAEQLTTLASRDLSFNEVAFYPNSVALFPVVEPAIISGPNPTVTVRLIRNQQQVIDQVIIPIVPDWYSGSPFLLHAGQTTSGGGFGQPDRDNLGLILGAVRAVMPAALTGGASLVMQVIDLVRGPPRSFLRRFSSRLLTGRGTLSAQPPGALHSFGGTWSIAALPAGYGRDDGVLVEYHRRLAQFVVLRDEVTSDAYVDVLEDSHNGQNFILWQFPNPIEIQYDIAPGVTILWEWLV